MGRTAGEHAHAGKLRPRGGGGKEKVRQRKEGLE